MSCSDEDRLRMRSLRMRSYMTYIAGATSMQHVRPATLEGATSLLEWVHKQAEAGLLTGPQIEDMAASVPAFEGGPVAPPDLESDRAALYRYAQGGPVQNAEFFHFLQRGWVAEDGTQPWPWPWRICKSGRAALIGYRPHDETMVIQEEEVKDE